MPKRKGPVPRPPEERFWPKVNKNGPVPERRPDLGPCWLWTGAINTARHDYGRFWTGAKWGSAHRFAYELLVGSIPAGRVLDHLCGVTACVNPGHLEAVTQRTNLLRSSNVAAERARKTHCSKGHPFDLLNTYVTSKGWRQCLECRREAHRRLAQRRKQERARRG